MLDLLLRQTRRCKIPAGLPEGTVCANKTGETENSCHDAAIVFETGCGYILVIMSDTNGLCSEQDKIIAGISQAVYEYMKKKHIKMSPASAQQTYWLRKNME